MIYSLCVTYIQFEKVASYMQIQRFKYVWEPFPHLKCENGSECGDLPIISLFDIQYHDKWYQKIKVNNETCIAEITGIGISK